ncbi:hypothetical protein PRK78_007546 [Emydomyces testavorans]|uniref:Cytochrome P450 n=1 Tax=Emydomyces testavorans TaxID=2070801 RepID=A0AAF0DRK8_9EURO|nr:hypothetical protein PRK78_007546 [Emydomyces testavorans]
MVCGAVLIYAIGSIAYRLYFSPLSQFPGPRLAAATLWYEFYYDVILKGQFTFKIKELHQKYGPIIRIGPYELHINDPDYYNILYSHNPPRDKYHYYVKPFDFPLSSFGTENAQLHRRRRAAMNPFFSRGKVLRQEALLQELIQNFCNRIEDFRRSGKVAPLSLGFTCLSTDLITSFVIGRSYRYIESPDWHPYWGQTLRSASEFGVVLRQLTWTLPILKSIPRSWAVAVNPGLALFFNLAKRIEERIVEVQTERNSTTMEDATLEKGHTLFDQVLESKLPPHEKQPQRLAEEVRSVVGAGTETTSNALTVITFHLLSNPEKLSRLRDELWAVEPNSKAEIKLCDLEKLPYLRKSDDQVIQYKQYRIPPGTAVGMTSVLQHHDESIFPDSYSYVPERWLDLEERKRLEKYLVAFSKGSRRCIGMK